MSDLKPPPPPPRRASPTSSPISPASPAPPESSWSAKLKAKGGVWGKKALDKGVIISDRVGGRVNEIAEKKFGTEAFWPVTGDLPKEMEKCARILRAFTVDGVITEEKTSEGEEVDAKGKKTKKNTVKVLRKIPPSVIANAQGIVIFTAMRTGFAPLGGAGGTGVVLARLPDGSWSAPASISPNNLSAGFLIGVDVYDCILILRSKEVVDGFRTHKFTLGAEIGIAAGPWGSGGSIESGKEKALVYSYIKSKGLYAGIEIVGQVFVERFDENGMMYHWKGVQAGDILSGKVRVPPEAANLHQALRDAETGKAQHEKGDALEMIVDDNAVPIASLDDGEVMKLPPRPDMTDGTEHLSDPETTKIKYESRPGSGTVTPIRTAPTLPPRTSSANQMPLSTTQPNYDYPPLAGPGPVPTGHSGYAPPPGPPPDFTSTSGPAIDAGGPPGYSEHGGPGPDFVPDQKVHITDPRDVQNEGGPSTSSRNVNHGLGSGSHSTHDYTAPPTSQPPNEEMSEAERREWDEYYAQQGLQAGVQDLNLGGQTQSQGERKGGPSI